MSVDEVEAHRAGAGSGCASLPSQTQQDADLAQQHPDREDGEVVVKLVGGTKNTCQGGFSVWSKKSPHPLPQSVRVAPNVPECL